MQNIIDASQSDMPTSKKASSSLQKNKSRSILEMNHSEAKDFFLKSKTYCDIELPQYFNFNPILEAVDKALGDKDILALCSTKPFEMENINYTIFNNKDGKYSWRPVQLIHPVLYVALVKKITEKIVGRK